MGKIRIRLTEEELADVLMQSIIGGDNNVFANYFKNMFQGKTSSTPTSVDNAKTQFPTNLNVQGGEFPTLNLNNPIEYNAYKSIADKFISSRSSNLLGITGAMLADAAKNALNQHRRYVPVELALAQLAAEGGFSKNRNARPIRTRNPFNVGNTDSGKNIYHSSVQSGIQRYYDLIAKNYLVGDKTANDLLKNFVNKKGYRYATGGKYEALVSQIANKVNTMSQPIYASLSKKSTSDMA
jgi:hypothetical protein